MTKELKQEYFPKHTEQISHMFSVHFICFQTENKKFLLQVNILLQDLKTVSVEISRNGKIEYVGEFICLPYHNGCFLRYQTVPVTFDTVCQYKECYIGTVTTPT